jgi:DNA-binding NarL/FixJ family response regulator
VVEWTVGSAVRFVFADDNYLMREGLAAVLAGTDDVELVGVAATPPELHAAVDTLRPDAVLTDIRMPPTYTDEGIVAARQIRAAHPDVGVVVLSQYVEEDYAFELLRDGATGIGYLLKERVAEVEELVHALKEVARGGSALDPKVVEALMTRSADHQAAPLARLTAREREVLEVMATGRTNAIIAKQLYMSERAVEKHVGTVFQKLGLTEESEINRRVMAVLTFLDATGRTR